MADEVLYNLGVDIGSDFTFHDGDIRLASYEDNLVQAVTNRLNTQLDELDLFYEDYGSVLTSFLGWKGNDTTIALIKVELANALQNEDRLLSHSADIYYDGDGVLRIELILNPSLETSIEVNLMMNSTGELEIVEEET